MNQSVHHSKDYYNLLGNVIENELDVKTPNNVVLWVPIATASSLFVNAEAFSNFISIMSSSSKIYPCESFLYISYFVEHQGIAFARECFQSKDGGHVSIRDIILNAIFIL